MRQTHKEKKMRLTFLRSHFLLQELFSSPSRQKRALQPEGLPQGPSLGLPCRGACSVSASGRWGSNGARPVRLPGAFGERMLEQHEGTCFPGGSCSSWALLGGGAGRLCSLHSSQREVCLRAGGARASILSDRGIDGVGRRGFSRWRKE